MDDHEQDAIMSPSQLRAFALREALAKDDVGFDTAFDRHFTVQDLRLRARALVAVYARRRNIVPRAWIAKVTPELAKILVGPEGERVLIGFVPVAKYGSVLEKDLLPGEIGACEAWRLVA